MKFYLGASSVWQVFFTNSVDVSASMPVKAQQPPTFKTFTSTKLPKRAEQFKNQRNRLFEL